MNVRFEYTDEFIFLCLTKYIVNEIYLRADIFSESLLVFLVGLSLVNLKKPGQFFARSSLSQQQERAS